MTNALDKCLVVGIAGLSLATLNTKLREGKLPTLGRLVATGELRPMVSAVSSRSPAAWASLSTGVGPASHGFVLNEEATMFGFRPAGYASWRAAPFWEKLNQAGLLTASVNWPGIIPGAAWQGRHVDGRLCIASGIGGDDWPLPIDVAPAVIREELRSIRVHPTEIPPSLIAPLIPAGSPASRETDVRLAVALARLGTLQAALDIAAPVETWDMLAIYQDWLVSITAALDCAADMLPDPAWLLLDQSLSLMLGRTSASSLVIIASIGADGPGFILARSPTFQAGRKAPAVSTLTVAPTILGHFGFSSAELARGLTSPRRALEPLPPWQAPNPPPDPDPSDIARLATFGVHIQPADPYCRALKLLAEAELIIGDDADRAAALAEDALSANPQSMAALGILATAKVTCGESAGLPKIAASMASIAPDHLWVDLVLGAYQAMKNDEHAARPHLERASREGGPDEKFRAGVTWLMLDRRMEAARIFREILDAQPQHLAALIALLSTETVRGTAAEQLLHRVLSIDPTHAAARDALQSLLRSLGRSVEAERWAHEF